MDTESVLRGSAPDKHRVDRFAKSQVTFDEFALQTASLNTVVLLLRSPEERIVLRAIQHIDKYASLYIGHFDELHKRGIIENLRPLLEHKQLYIARFAMKLTAQMFCVADAADELCSTDDCRSVAIRAFLTSTDNFLIEFSAMMLIRLAVDDDHLEYMLRNNRLIPQLLHFISKTRDPDILLHSLMLLTILSHQSAGLDAVAKRQDFPFEKVFAALRSEFDRIRLAAIELLSIVVYCSTPAFTQNFEKLAIVEQILEILENPERKSVHSQTVNLLQKILRRPIVAELFYRDVCLERFVKFVRQTEPSAALRWQAIGLLGGLASAADSRPILHDLGVSEMLMDALRQGEVESVVQGITSMMSHDPAAKIFHESGAVRLLFEVLKSSTSSFSNAEQTPKATKSKKGTLPTVVIDPALHMNVRKVAANCLADIFRKSRDARMEGIACDAIAIIAGLLAKDNHRVPIELKMPLIRMLNCMAQHEELQQKVMTDEMAEGLFGTLMSSEKCIPFRVEVLQCMTNYIDQETLHDQLMDPSFAELMIDALSGISGSFVLKRTVVNLILASRKLVDLTNMYIDHQVLDCIMSDADSLANCPNWSAAIDTILDNNLPVKFSRTGRLDPNDVTANHFYAQRHIWPDCWRLRQIFNADCSPHRPIYLCNFTPIRSVSTICLTSIQTIRPASTDRTSNGISWSASTATNSRPYNLRPEDSNLVEYLRIAREALDIQLLTEPSLSRFDQTRRCVEILCDLVCSKMCSRPRWPEVNKDEEEKSATSTNDAPEVVEEVVVVKSSESLVSLSSEEAPCLADIVQKQLDALKLGEYDCNIIPLGALRVGGHFEKSLLFKVLADRVGLSCGLRLLPEDNCIAWNEVAMPTDSDISCQLINDDGQIMSRPDTVPLVATHVVDLMDTPGSLYALGSLRALQYQRQRLSTRII